MIAETQPDYPPAKHIDIILTNGYNEHNTVRMGILGIPADNYPSLKKRLHQEMRESMKKYKIGEMAHLLGTTTQTLRFYEQEGIIAPQKTENGTRYFMEFDIVRLMAFKRFQLIDFTVQDVAQHFKTGSLDSLMDRMEETSVRLRQESENLLRRAQAIDQFNTVLRSAQQEIDQITWMVRPTVYMHRRSLSELDQLNGLEHERFMQFMNAMPNSHINFLYNPIRQDPVQFHFTITETAAQTWQLPLEGTRCIASGECVRLFVRTDARLWQTDYLNEQIARVKEAGYTVDESLPVIGQHIVSDYRDRQMRLIAAIYVPIIPAQ